MPIHIKNNKEIERMRAAGQMAANTLSRLSKIIYNGITGKEIEEFVKKDTEVNGGICAPYQYKGTGDVPFPGYCCISECGKVLCHGIPSDKPLKNCAINVDITTIYDDAYGDTSEMFILGEVNKETENIIQITKECLDLGIQEAKPGKRLGDIGYVIEQHALKNGLFVSKDFAGHGIGFGKNGFHQEPLILHFGNKNSGPRILPGMTFTIEPIILSKECNFENNLIYLDPKDNWTVKTNDNSIISAQFEHTIAITENGNEIFTK